MNLSFFSRYRRAILLCLALLVVGAFFRWEVREVNDAKTGQPLVRYRGIVFPWQACGATGSGRQINFHVQHWLCYGLVKLEATGQTM